jgi:hypothetical protein
MTMTSSTHGPASRKDLRSFGLIVGGVFAVIAVWPLVFRGAPVRLWLLALAAALVVPALVAPRILSHPYRVWMAIGTALGWINTRIILSIVFFGMITPMGFVMRLSGRDPMRRNFESDAATYRVPARPRPGTHMLRQF